MNELTAIVTGASRGFGRAVSAALVTNGAHVVGVARTRVDLDDVRAALGDGFTAVTADAADPGNRGPAHRRIPAARGGAVRGCRPAHGSAAGSDVGDVQRELERQRRTSLPLDSGGAAIAVSARKLRDRILERCSDKGSPLSGGYAGADSTIRFITDYARIESDRAGLGIDFVSVLPQSTPATGLGAAAVAAYAERPGVGVDDFAKSLAPVLTPELVGKAILELAAAGHRDHGSYVLSAAGLSPIP